MKAYTKPKMEFIHFKANEQIAAGSIYDYNDNENVPVTVFEITQSSWNGESQS